MLIRRRGIVVVLKCSWGVRLLVREMGRMLVEGLGIVR